MSVFLGLYKCILFDMCVCDNVFINCAPIQSLYAGVVSLCERSEFTITFNTHQSAQDTHGTFTYRL